MKLDKFWVGAIIGLIVPVISFFIFMAVVFKTHTNYGETLTVLNEANMATKAMTACIIPTFLLFFFFYWRKYNRIAQGLVFSALILTFAMVIYAEFG